MKNLKVLGMELLKDAVVQRGSPERKQRQSDAERFAKSMEGR